MPDRRKVLVTGGAGYIGSHTCKALARDGFLPVTFDNLSRGHEWAVKWGPLVVGDIADGEALRKAFQVHRPIAVIHFAAFAYVGESVTDPAMYYHNNVAGSLSLLRAALEAEVESIVFSSTCSTYGVPDTIPIDETHEQRPVNPYGATKLAVERMLADFGIAYGMRSMSLRYFNAAGADPEGEIGECHDPETHALPLAILSALGGNAPFQIFGTDYPTPDGTAIRDYIHVSDLATGHVAALLHLLKDGKSLSLNLGTGHGHSVRELVSSVERVSGKQVDVREAPRRAGDPPVLIADASSAKETLGWQPKFISIDDIVETALAWHKANSRVSSS
ncbi:MAG: UDP-glucose 4-epimerase GalE [Halioglobus sp.]